MNTDGHGFNDGADIRLLVAPPRISSARKPQRRGSAKKKTERGISSLYSAGEAFRPRGFASAQNAANLFPSEVNSYRSKTLLEID
jgi:hypothetical protein